MDRLAISKHSLLPIGLLSTLALLGNIAALPLFHTVDILFGSVFVMFAAALYRVRATAIVAFVGAAYTWVLWGHPYAIAIFVVEAIFVARLYPRFGNVVIADLVFWCTVGIPMAFSVPHFILGMTWDNTLLITMKQPLNGVFNAMIAGLLILTWQRFISTKNYIPDQNSNWYFYTILIMVIVGGAVPIIKQGYEAQSQEESKLANNLQLQASRLEANLSLDDADPLSVLALVEDAFEQDDVSIAIVDKNGSIVAQRGNVQTLNQSQGRFTQLNDQLLHWSPQNIEDGHRIWQLGKYQLNVEITSHPTIDKIVFEMSSAPLIAHVKNKSLFMFAFLSVLTLIAIFLTYQLTKPLKRIMQVASEANDGVIITDKNGRVEWINKAITELIGYTLDELKGKKPGDILQGPGTDPETVERMSKAIRSQQGFSEAILNYGKDGKTHYVLVNSNPLYSDSGELNGYMAIQKDITHEMHLEKLEAFSSHILEAIAKNYIVEDILHLIIKGVESLKPNFIVSIVLLDHKHQKIAASYSNQLPAFYNEALMGLELGEYVGSCGAAVFSGKRFIVEDIASHPNWTDFKDLAARANLAACWSQPFFNAKGEVVGTFAIYHHTPKLPSVNDLEVIDKASSLVAITMEKYESDRKLMQAANVFAHASEGILITNIDGEIIDANQAFTRITGYQRDDIIGKNPSLLSSGLHGDETYEAIFESLSEHGDWKGELWNKNKDGQLFAVLESISTVYDHNGKPQNYIALFSDITKIKDHQKQLENLANYDALTQLPNRALLTDRMQQAMALSKREGSLLIIVFIDLDGFKPVNDRYGHDVGDKLLISFAQRMSLLLRETDTLARLAGDEFVTLLPNIQDFASCEPLLDRMLTAVDQPFIVDDKQLKISASMGVTIFPQAYDLDADQLLRQADQAMYLAKQDGKNRYHLFDATQHQIMRDHHDNLIRIQQAIANNEFVLHYQPKVNLRTGDVIGVEALIRWQHPEKGLLSPAAFLPVLENHPAMIDLDIWVLHTALQQIQAWQESGLSLGISINIDPMHLQHPTFVTDITEALDRFPSVSADKLELEIVETAAIEDINMVSKVIHECHGLGVHFSLDDFGTGYSSLTYLKQLPIHILKIDQSFVRDILDDQDDLAIVKGVLGLAKSFNRIPIAEGVETTEHGSLLLQLGCELAQGYGISRPIEASLIPKWIEQWHHSGAKMTS